MQLLNTLAGIGWEPQIRGFLSVGVGVVVLMGSVYLLLATNTGNRLGFLLAATGFWGWMVIMGIIWWIYGIGMIGAAPHWEVREFNIDQAVAANDDLRRLDTSQFPEDPAELYDLEPGDYETAVAELNPTLTSGWTVIAESDPSFGETKAAVDEAIVEEPLTSLGLDSTDDYIVAYVFERGGKDTLGSNPSRWDRVALWLEHTFVNLRHPAHHAVVEIQPVIPQEAEPGQPPPTPEADPDKPVVRVLLERNIGDRRFPAAMITLASGIFFGVLCNMLHRRDRLVAAARDLVPAGGG
ncbi:MAG: hypothetical protein AB7L84_16845 [Acidimicrobiia bacterium]